MWRAFNPQSCLLLVAVACAAPTGDEAGHLSEVRQWEASVTTGSKSVVKRSPRTVNSFQEIPATTFTCAAQESPGIFADQETGCQVFHYCQPGGRVDSFFCPNLTLFNQQYFVCDWEYNVDCSLASKYFPLNHQLFESTPPLQIIPGIAATTQTDLLGAASSAEAIHSLNHIQGAHHVAHTAALLGNVETSINTNTFTGSSPVVPALSTSTASSGRIERRRGNHGRSKSSAAELRRPNLSEGIKEEMGEEGEVGKSRYEGPSKSRRGGKALRRIKTFLRREKKYVVVDQGGQSSQRSRTRENFSEPTSAKIVGFQGLWSLKNS